MFTDGDATCDNVPNLAELYNNVSTHIQEVTWTDGRLHASLSGANDEVFFNSLAGQLQVSEPETFDCYAVDLDLFVWSAFDPTPAILPPAP